MHKCSQTTFSHMCQPTHKMVLEPPVWRYSFYRSPAKNQTRKLRISVPCHATHIQLPGDNRRRLEVLLSVYILRGQLNFCLKHPLGWWGTICTGQSTEHTENALLETYEPFLLTCNEASDFVVNKCLAMYLKKETACGPVFSQRTVNTTQKPLAL